MSISRINLAWSAKGLKANEKLVLMALADIADDDGFCWPSMAHIGLKCDCSERTVRRVVRKLEAGGLVATDQSKGRSSNRYVVIPDPDKLAGLNEANPEEMTGSNPDNLTELNQDKVTGMETQPGQTGSPTRTQLCPPNHQEPPITLLANARSVGAREEPDPPPKKKRKTSIPENAVPTEADYRAAEKRGLSTEEADHEFTRFKNHHLAKGSTFVAWGRAWLTWLDSPYRKPRVGQPDQAESERRARMSEYARANF